MRPTSLLLLLLFGASFPVSIRGEDQPVPKPTRRVHVVVALCDNEHQGIAPVNARIGDGDKLETNLYWGCSDGLWRYFLASDHWTLVDTLKAKPGEDPDDPWKGVSIMEMQTWKHVSGEVELVAEAWRGREIEGATERFLDLLAKDRASGAEVVAWIGHNGLMDFRIQNDRAPAASAEGVSPRQAIVLCCRSRTYFSGLLEDMKVEPLLMTEQLMYPGSFLLAAALEGWIAGESREQVRERAAKAYGKNQGISIRAARGIFSSFE